MKSYSQKILAALILPAGAVALVAHAATPVVDSVASSPLVVSAQAEPNIMFLLDSSGGMDHLVAESFDPTTLYRYDSTTDYALTAYGSELSAGSACADSPATAIDAASYQVSLSVDALGNAQIELDPDISLSLLSPYVFGYNAGEYCFNSNATYQAALRTDFNKSSNGTSLSFYTTYTGNFLNWYFSSPGAYYAPANFGVGATRKPYTKSRLEIMKESVVGVLQGLNQVRVGLATFDMGGTSQWSGMASTPYSQGVTLTNSELNNEFLKSGDNAVIQVPLDSISNNQSAMISAIGYDTSTSSGDESTGVDAFGFAPLASAVAAVGRYFIAGRVGTVTAHPGDSYGVTASDVSATDLLEITPVANGFSLPSSASTNPMAANSNEWCRKNFLVTVTGSDPSMDEDDFSGSNLMLDYDQDCAAGGCGSDDKKNTAGYSYSYDGSDYLDDVAAALYDIDWLPGINDDSGNAYRNNIISYFVSIGGSESASNALFSDAATNGGGAYISASDSDQLLSALTSQISAISNEVGSIAAVAFNSSSLDTGSSVFIAQFNTARWSGKLYNYELDPASGLFLDTDGITTSTSINNIDPAWEASAILDAATYTSRNILTYDGSNGVAFTVANLNASPSNLSSAMVADLSAGNGTAQEVMQFLMGDTSLEGTQFRNRDSVLGDLVNSTPSFIGDPTATYPDASPFPTGADNHITWAESYRTGTVNRKPMVYIGSNDGMLHGFNANLATTSSGGDEEMAYVPSFVVSANTTEGLHYLSSFTYSHKFYADHTVSAADVYITDPSGSADAWKTIIVGGVRAGGRGLYALDVTDDTFTGNDVLWEFSSADEPDLGYTFSRPTVAMTKNSKWSVIVGNGYNSPDGGGDGIAKLLILDIEAGMDGWTSGDYIEISTGVGSTTWPNGLSSPRVVDLNNDSVADRVYAGDLYGNLWCFDISSNNSSNWDSCYKSGSTPKPLFKTTSTSTAPTAGDTLKPITTTPLVARIPGTTGETVYFGTGQYILGDDITNLDEQSFYAVLDPDSSSNTPLDESDLEPRTLVQSGSLRTVTGNTMDWSAKSGWYMDFPVSGERAVTRATIVSNLLFFNTIIPSSTTCDSGGTGWLMSFDFKTGLAPADPAFDANNDGTIDGSDANYVGMLFSAGLPSESKMLGKKRYTAGSDGGVLVDGVNVNTTAKEGRLSWEEIN
ncbi:pilus assembly protein [Halioxenophilus sp. WMMB6]|uniref:pilus assembly protein n=1 Tax=Halioxenophilus sp. WMMB6 TaxID=3073815 RepID=UPI00295E5EAD|nr:PilC/PilY family type IV pilus protein [Halioxenophilus sp. WMMB6]